LRRAKGPSAQVGVLRDVDAAAVRATMKFGHKFADIIEATHPSVSDQFLCYKTLKKCLKNIPEEVVKVAGPGGAGGSVARRDLAPGETSTLPPASVRLTQLTDEQRAFIKTLNNELQKFNTFFINSEEDFVMKEMRLEGEYAAVVDPQTGERARGVLPERHRRVLRAFADFHGELVLMEHWVSLNYTALVKILKKHDKRSSSLSLRSPFLVSVLQQPFYSTEVLSGLIVKVERMFRQLSVMTTAGEAGELTGAALEPAAAVAAGAAAAGIAGVTGSAEAGAGSGPVMAAVVAAGASGLVEEDVADVAVEGRVMGGESGCESESTSASASEGQLEGLNLARTKAAMECWDGMKGEESILRPYGDVPGSRRGDGGGSGGTAEAETTAAVTASEEGSGKRRTEQDPGGDGGQGAVAAAATSPKRVKR